MSRPPLSPLVIGLLLLVSWLGSAVPQMSAPGSTMTAPMPSMPIPFKRVGDPIRIAATEQATTHRIVQPDNTTSYRGINACDVDVRIKTMSDWDSNVTLDTGTVYLARTTETFSSSANPIPGQARLVSIMTTAPPGPQGCIFEMQYGNGG